VAGGASQEVSIRVIIAPNPSPFACRRKPHSEKSLYLFSVMRKPPCFEVRLLHKDQMKEKTILAGNLRGILLLIASVSCFGIVDGINKILIEAQSFGQVVLARYALALPVLLVATNPGKWKNLFETQLVGLQIIRGLIPVVIGGAMVFARQPQKRHYGGRGVWDLRLDQVDG
jgi:hypothetical protein